MSFVISRQQRQRMRTENKKWGKLLVEIHRAEWPKDNDQRRINVWRSQDFLVQEYLEDEIIRISVNRTMVDADGNWTDQISWDELMMVKRQIGHGDTYAIEIYPKDCDIVNVANMRHLWLLEDPLPIGWTSN